MILLVLFEEIHPKTKQKTGRMLVSHGINTVTLENVALPQEPPNELNARWHQDLQGWILD
ncbi:hypothetical protein ACFYKX_11265 [Cytobacillus sp. FJAT-54145]|uniref:Uncharacterized protein n=1 Tax=Cytobacillus spartinae TaxID=3299023 RepID=A0ABW6KAC9_9BACI